MLKSVLSIDKSRKFYLGKILVVIGKHCGLGSCQMSMVETIRGTKAIIYHHLAFIRSTISQCNKMGFTYLSKHTHDTNSLRDPSCFVTLHSIFCHLMQPLSHQILGENTDENAVLLGLINVLSIQFDYLVYVMINDFKVGYNFEGLFV